MAKVLYKISYNYKWFKLFEIFGLQGNQQLA